VGEGLAVISGVAVGWAWVEVGVGACPLELGAAADWNAEGPADGIVPFGDEDVSADAQPPSATASHKPRVNLSARSLFIDPPQIMSPRTITR
jgi:hypothetical protein